MTGALTSLMQVEKVLAMLVTLLGMTGALTRLEQSWKVLRRLVTPLGMAGNSVAFVTFLKKLAMLLLAIATPGWKFTEIRVLLFVKTPLTTLMEFSITVGWPLRTAGTLTEVRLALSYAVIRVAVAFVVNVKSDVFQTLFHVSSEVCPGPEIHFSPFISVSPSFRV
jgi:hypothetical protein